MNCESIEPLLGAWLAGEIRPEERAEAEAHLLECAGCRADFELARIGMRVEWPAEAAPTVSRSRPPRGVALLKLGTAAALLIAALAMAGRREPPLSAPVLASFSDGTLGAILVRDEEGKPQGDLRLLEHRVSVEILDGVALTTVEENFENRSERRLEGTFRFPLPQDAAISRLALEVNGKMEEGTCLERERAREVFESIVRRQKDPALLEWLPGGIFQCRIFPIEPRSTKRVIVGYTQVLPFSRGRLRYAYPLASEKTREHPPGLLEIEVRARFSGTLSALSSPTHRLDVQRRDVHEASASFRASHLRPNDDFVVELETADDEVRVVAHKEDGEDGYLAVFVAPQLAEARVPRRYAILVDASASVSAPAFEAAGKVVDALRAAAIPGDRLDVAWFNVDVERTPVRPLGGCDLLKALRSVDADETILIGECTPTLGETDRAAIVEPMKGRRIRTIAIGSQLDTGLLEKLGPVAVIAPGEDVARRAAQLASTLGAPLVRNLRIEGPVTEVVGARDVFAGERVLLAARYASAGAPLTLRAEGWRREVELPKESGHAWVKRLWAQRRVSDLLAANGPREQVVALGVKHQIMTPYTSFLVLETEQMWKDFQLERTLGKREQLLGKGKPAESEAAAHDLATKREVTRKIAHLLELAYMAHDQKRYDRGIKLLDEVLLIDPHYAVAREFKEDLEKTRHKEEYHNILAQKVARWKRLTDDDDQAVIPFSQTVRFPSRDEWSEVSKRLTEAVIKTEGSTPDGDRARESQQHYDQALRFHSRGDFERAKIEAQKAVESWHENLEARRLLNDVNSRVMGGREEFRVKVEQAQIEITKNVRDGERFLNARMYDKAIQQLQDAEFKILNTPYEVRPMQELLPFVRESMVKAKNARLLEELRVEESKRREAESEAVAVPLVRRPKGISELEEDDTVDRRPDAGGWERGANRAWFSDRNEWGGYLGDRVELPSPTAGGAGPILGATFALDEPAFSRASKWAAGRWTELEESYAELLRERTSPSAGEGRPPVTFFRMFAPQAFTAKVESGKLIDGRPVTPPDDADSLLGKLLLRRHLSRLQTKSFDGKPLGSLDYDPQTHVFILRDLRLVLERVGAEIARLEAKGAIPGLEADRVTLKAPAGSVVRSLIDTLQQQSGWRVSLEGAPRLATAFSVENELVEDALRTLAASCGARLEVSAPGQALLCWESPLGDLAVPQTIEALAVTLGTAMKREIVLDPESRGVVQIPLSGMKPSDALRAALKSLNLLAVSEPSGRIRILSPDVLLRDMETRVFPLKMEAIAVEGYRQVPARWTLVEDEAGRPALSGPAARRAEALLAVSRGSRFIAVARVLASGRLEAIDGLSLDRLLPGDAAEEILDPKRFLQDLPEAVRRDLASRRALLDLRERLEGGR